MPLTRRQFLVGAAAIGATAAAAGCAPDWMSGLDEKPTALPPGATPMPGSTPYSTGAVTWTPTPFAAVNVKPPSAIAFALTRMTFGPRPGDVERVTKLGLDNYIEQQLHPEMIDDGAMDKLLEQFPSLKMTFAELIDNYPQPKPQDKPKNQPTPGPGTPQPTPPPKGQRPPGPGEVISELQQATLLRAIFSERQLFEMMADFWTNHFNIYIGKQADKWMKTVDDREVIRKYALGKFKDMLTASAKSPAMLEYLDNRVSVKGKPNENYAREIMELHTLGVDGGYTYTDIQNVARAFTGWTIAPPRAAGRTGADGYIFNARQHDDDEKTVLGVKIPKGGGETDGMKVIEILANHPSTAKFLATKMVRRFVSDTPPDALVQKVAATYQKTGGDIREMMSVILHSDEFKNSYGQKARRPLEFVAGTLRALDVKVDGKDGDILRMVMNSLGQPLFQWPTPDGFPDFAGAWINTNGLLARWNIALNLMTPGGRGIKADTQAPTTQANPKSAADVVDYWVNRLLSRPMAAADRDKLINYLTGGVANVTLNDQAIKTKVPGLVALVVSSPDYQYR
ncbi:MAG: DUF1800 domain-containing protein [Chloroflexota bacterium]